MIDTRMIPGLNPHLRRINTAQTVVHMKKRLLISSGESFILVDFQDITRCEANGSYCGIYTRKGQRFVVSKTLAKVSEVLPAGMFLRVHQSHLVYYGAIASISRYELTLRDGTEIPIARARKNEVLESIRERSVAM